MQGSLRKLCSLRLVATTFMGIFCGARFVLWCLIFLAIAGAGPQPCDGQSSISQPGPLPSLSGRPRPLGDEPSQFPRDLEKKALKMRNEQRQKQIVSDASKLLALTRELEAEVDMLSTRPFAPATFKKAAEVEKLARSVKDKMKAE